MENVILACDLKDGLVAASAHVHAIDDEGFYIRGRAHAIASTTLNAL